MSSEPMDCVPFVVGCGRSGTTLLRAMLDSHPLLVVPGESRFVPMLLEHQDELATSPTSIDEDRFVALLEPNIHFQHWGISASDLRDELRSQRPADVPDAVRMMFSMHAERAGKPRYGDKSPTYVMHLPALARAFPEGRFVHLIRDGRDVALAYMDAEFGPDSAREMALHWQLRVRRGMDAGAALGSRRYLEVRYEDLVSEPKQVLGRICTFIDLDFDDAMLDYPSRAGDLVVTDRQPWNHTNLSRAPTVGLRDWRAQMARSDVATFELLAGRTLRDLDYPSSGVSPTPRDRAAAVTAQVQWQARRARKKMVPGVDGRRKRALH